MQALDGCELLPSRLSGVDLSPWLSYRQQASYSSIDLREPSTEYTPLTQEWCLFEATLGEEPPEGHVAELVACAAGRLNAVLWSWEADLDDGGGVASPLTNTPVSYTHLRAHET